MKTKKHMKQKPDGKKTVIKLLMILFILIAIGGIGYLIFNSYQENKDKKDYTNILGSIQIDTSKITEKTTERMLQLEELQKQNSEIIGWLEIDGTVINYPVLQTTDNDFYLTHNYKKEWSPAGSLFLDKDFDMINGSSNFLIYGHRHGKGIMFEELIKYADQNFYKDHTKIKFTTNQEEAVYEILSVFYSKVYYASDQNVFRYYYFVDANTKQEYDEYVNQAKKASIYDTGVTAEYPDQLLTLSTCEYSQKDGRFVVVAKKINS